MLLPKLSPLESRLLVSVLASITLLLLYFFSSAPIFAYAIDVNSEESIDYHYEEIRAGASLFDDFGLDTDEMPYKYDSTASHVEIAARQSPGLISLNNNVMVPINVEKGQLVSFIFTNNTLWSTKTPISPAQSPKMNFYQENRAFHEMMDDVPGSERFQEVVDPSQRTVYVTVTTCLQPQPIAPNTAAPQLQLYISESFDNMFPGPSQNEDSQKMIGLDGGFALYTLNATEDVFIGLYAKNESTYTGFYNAQVAASIDVPYHSCEFTSNPNLFVADSDSSSVLLYTDPFINNTTNETLLELSMKSPPPFVMFVIDTPDIHQTGIHKSFCGLQNYADLSKSRVKTKGELSNVVTRITRHGTSKSPRQQFFMDGLSSDKTYTAALGMNGNPTEAEGLPAVGGGGKVFTPIKFSTQADENCKLISNLSFCDQVAYSVPWNPVKFPDPLLLAEFYDNSAKAVFENFKKVLAQIPCETTASAQYSLARTCDDCAKAYKTWLCAVSIPRCTDIKSDLPWLQPRAIDQAFPNGSFLTSSDLSFSSVTVAERNSRNKNIDAVISPGPHKEILPCQELCHDIVVSCPAALGFSCPRVDQIGFNTSYGQMPVGWVDENGRNSNFTCNFPGKVYFSAAASRSSLLIRSLSAVAIMLIMSVV